MDYENRQAACAKAQNLKRKQIARKCCPKRPKNRWISYVLMLSANCFAQNGVSKNRRSEYEWMAFCGKTTCLVAESGGNKSQFCISI